MSDPIDWKQRPTSYFRPVALDAFLLRRVQNDVLRTRLEELIDRGQGDEVRRLLGDAGLSRADQRAFERLHPALMGGNYLPNTGRGEIEIARISIDSTTHDVTCVDARRSGRRIAYRVVDEYGGDTLAQPTRRTSIRPLTLAQLMAFFMSAWPLEEVVEANFEDDLAGKLGFFRATSPFYPELGRACSERVVAHHGGR